jgi:lysophospholipase L1-like esterase
VKPHKSPAQASGGRKPAVTPADQKRINFCNVIRTLTHPARLLVFGACILMIGTHSAFGQENPDPGDKPRVEFELKDGDRVVFLGNTFIERMQRYGYVETMLTTRWPDRKIIFRNLGWSGDTVWAESRNLFDLSRSRATPSKGYTRMIEHVGRIKPTVIFLGYGNNEAFEGEKGLPAFIKQYEKLMDDLRKVSAKGLRFVVIRPYLHRGRGKAVAHQNRNVVEYRDALLKLAIRRKLFTFVPFLDLSAETNILDGETKANDSNRFEPGYLPATLFEGVHLSEAGYRASFSHWLVQINRSFQPGILPVLAFKASGELLEPPGFLDVKVMRRDGGLNITAQRMALVDSGMMFHVSGLPAGKYTLKIDGKPVRTADVKDAAWEFYGSYGPDAAQYEKLRAAVVAKNQLYFYSWRPQNTTYLLGFRKHEQGQNAKEISEFAKLVADKEREIDRLKKPVSRTYELIRVKKGNK